MTQNKLVNTEFMALYVRELSAACLEAKRMLEELQGKLPPLEGRIQTFHRLKGVSAIIGYDRLGIAAGQIEQLLKASCPDHEQLDHCLRHFVNLVESSELLK